MKQRAYILVYTLGLGALVFATIMVAAPGTSLTSVQVGQEASRLHEDTATGTFEKGVAALLYDNDFAGDVSWNAGNLTFRKSATAPYSLNNVRGTTSASGYQERIVAPGQVHLAATRAKTTVQGLVEPFHQMMVEDFNGDGQGGQPRIPWIFYPGSLGYKYDKGWCYLGSPLYQQNREQFMLYPNERWTDYDVQVHVAYYGTTSFGLSVRNSTQWDGYRLELQPRIGLEKIDGLDVTVTGLPGIQGDSVAFPDPAQLLKDPEFKFDTALSDKPATYFLQVSVRGSQLWLSVWDVAKSDWRMVGQAFDLSRLSEPLQKAGSPKSSFDHGGIGVWADVATGIGVTDLVVKARDRTLLRRLARWEN